MALVAVTPAGAAGPFVVNTWTDTLDANPGNGVCADAAANCSLRAAVQEANALAGPDTISLPPAMVFSLTRQGANEDAAATGDLDVINGALTIQGNGSTIFGNRHDRVIHTRGQSLTLQNLTLGGGDAGTSPGGALLALPQAAVTLTDVEVTDNTTASFGGGAFVLGSLTIDGGRVSDNHAVRAGGIAAVGALALGGVAVEDNVADDHFGGVVAVGPGPVSLTGATIARNTSRGFGGGVHVEAPTTITDSTLTDNHSTSGFGGGLVAAATTTITRSTLSSNTSVIGGGILSFANLTVTDSTISGNTADGAGGLGLGGATTTIVNTTISGNTATSLPGGGILNSSALTVNSATITANTGAGLYTLAPGELTTPGGTSATTNSIVADQSSGPDCAGLGPIVSGGHNVSSTTECSFSGTGDQQGVAALLGPLADNGGPTATHEPTPVSPAIDTASPTCPATDQRATARPQGASCDSGAVEVDADSSHLMLVVDSTADAVDAAPGDLACSTPAGACTLRAAVMEANASPTGSHTITVQPGTTYTLTRSGTNEDQAATGDLDLRSDITLIASGSAATIDASDLDRVLEVHAQAVVTVRNIAIVDGNIGTIGPAAVGGGAMVHAGSRLTLDDTRVASNLAGDGAGIRNAGELLIRGESSIDHNTGGGIWNEGTARITGSGTSVSANTGDLGAGIHNEYWADFDVIGTTIDGNVASHDGGGIFNTGTMALVGVTLTSNTVANPSQPNDAGYGGGFENDGTLTIRGSTISGNAAGNAPTLDGYGGGGVNTRILQTADGTTFTGNTAGLGGRSGIGGNLWNRGDASIVDTTITDGWADDGGGIDGEFGSTLVIQRSTIADNTATEQGGGIRTNGTLAIDDSTISGNSAGEGGGILATWTTTITDSTITGNTATNGPGEGGGIYLHLRQATVKNSIISGNTADIDCSGTGTWVSQGYNYRGATCPLSAVGDVTGSAPNLAPLADNGGFTPTHLPNVGSPVIGTGNPACAGTDQRGLPRPQGGTCDKGAVDR